MKLGDLKSELIQEQHSLKKKIKSDVSIKFKSEGNKIEHTFNEEVLEMLQKLYKQLPVDLTQQLRSVLDITDKIKGRNKLIRIADSSPADWGTVREYESSAVADDSDDEKKIRQAQSRALRIAKERSRVVHSHTRRYLLQLLVNHQLKRILIQYSHRCINVNRPFVGALHGVSRAPGMCVMPGGNSDTGGKTVHFSSPSQQTTLMPESTPPNSETTSATACSAVVNDKYFLCGHLNWVDESHEFTHFLEQVHYFEDMSKCSENCQDVKGSLARHVTYWGK